jgi:hypothetical protein
MRLSKAIYITINCARFGQNLQYLLKEMLFEEIVQNELTFENFVLLWAKIECYIKTYFVNNKEDMGMTNDLYIGDDWKWCKNI